MKKAQKITEYTNSALTDCGIARCPDILAFHWSLSQSFEKYYDFGGERHPFYELVFVSEGTVGITAGDEVYTLTSGQVLLHHPDEFHRIWSEFESAPRVRNLSFYAAAIPVYGNRVLQPSEEECRELCEICDAVTDGLSANDRLLLNEQRLRLELWLLRMTKNDGEAIVRPTLPSALRYAEIVNLLHTRLQEQLSAQEIASLCNISLSALKKIFTRYAGMGVSRYFTEMKMRYAAEQLQTGMRVGEVAAYLGYFDQNYFSTVFRRVMGAPPGSFRINDKKAEIRPERKERSAMKFITVPSYDKMSRQAANIISAQIIMKPHSVIGLTAGASPLGTYHQLASWYTKGDIDFSEVTTVNLDEYAGLSETDSRSYHYFMQTNFFNHINIRKENVFIPDGESKDPEKECAEYDARIERLGGIDLQLLGIGVDGRIGFNEPSNVFEKSTHVVDLHESTVKSNAAFFGGEANVPKKAITMGLISIMQAKKIVLIANGKQKKDILQRAFYGPITPEIPASILQLHPDITIIFSEE